MRDLIDWNEYLAVSAESQRKQKESGRSDTANTINPGQNYSISGTQYEIRVSMVKSPWGGSEEGITIMVYESGGVHCIGTIVIPTAV